jgi:acetyltransferase
MRTILNTLPLEQRSVKHKTRTPMDDLLRPTSIALVGASERPFSAGARVLRNIVRGGFPGQVFPVNPKYDTLMSLKCYPSLDALPQAPDVAFLAVAADRVIELVDQAGRLGTRAIMTNAVGFADAGPEGLAREERLVAVARRHGIVLCGPNNSGYMNLWDRTFPSTFFQIPPHAPGPVAFISQSGSVSTALSQDDRGLGLGYNITTGTEAVLSVVDYAEAVVEDARISTLLFFLETLRDPNGFARVARRAARLGKRIVVTKVGRSEAGRKVAAAHSGAIAGDDKMYDAYFSRHGIVRANDLDEMIELGLLFKMQAPPAARGTVLMSISGGENGLMSDVAADVGLSLDELSPSTRTALTP